jgi:hypothetical protein
MIKYCLTLVLFFFCTLGALAQRYGRADAIQNYMGPKSPQLLLQVKVQGKRLYFRPAELRKMQRSVATVTDAVTGTMHTYEGVKLDTLVPDGMFIGNSGTIEVFFGSHQNLTIAVMDLDPASKPMIADTIDRKRLTGYTPYYLLTKTRQGNLDAIKNVKQISVGLAH